MTCNQVKKSDFFFWKLLICLLMISKIVDVGIPETPTPPSIGKHRQWGDPSPPKECRRLKWMVPKEIWIFEPFSNVLPLHFVLSSSQKSNVDNFFWIFKILLNSFLKSLGLYQFLRFDMLWPQILQSSEAHKELEVPNVYSRLRNKQRATLINFWKVLE